MSTTSKRAALRRLLAAALILTVLAAAGGRAFAAGRDDDDEKRYTNKSTGYEVYIRDEEDLLTDSQERSLVNAMKPVTEYGGCGFVSTSSRDAAGAAEKAYREWFGTDSGTLLLIDMGEREVRIYSDGAVYRTVNKQYANLITDNIYRYLSNQKYFDGAKEAFGQIATILEGGKIAQPMRHITCALAALVLGLLLNFIVVWRRKNAGQIAGAAVLTAGTAAGVAVTSRLLSSTRTYHEPSSSSSSGGGYSGGGRSSGGGGGGFSGGGGHSGGGGGHKF